MWRDLWASAAGFLQLEPLPRRPGAGHPAPGGPAGAGLGPGAPGASLSQPEGREEKFQLLACCCLRRAGRARGSSPRGSSSACSRPLVPPGLPRAEARDAHGASPGRWGREGGPETSRGWRGGRSPRSREGAEVLREASAVLSEDFPCGLVFQLRSRALVSFVKMEKATGRSLFSQTQ